MDRLYLLAPVYGGLIIGCKSSLAGEERDEKERERERKGGERGFVDKSPRLLCTEITESWCGKGTKLFED